MPTEEQNPHIVVCEGDSERAYLQELNKFLRQENIWVRFTPKPSNTGEPDAVIKTYRNISRQNRNTKVWLWIDKDIYVRNPDKLSKLYNKIPDENILFSQFNFEDFLFCHTTDMLEKWTHICIQHEHFQRPMHSKECLRCVKQILPRYIKGEIPEEIQINENTLNILFQNNQDDRVPYQHTFADWLHSILPFRHIDR